MQNTNLMIGAACSVGFVSRGNNKKGHALRAGIALILTSLLASCGGDESNATPLPPTPVGGITVVDGFGTVRPNTVTRVDLSAFVRGQGATLTALDSSQPGCNASGLFGLTAEVTIDNAGLCQYDFTASNGSAKESASLNLLASSKASPVLPTLSQAMTLDDGIAIYDLQSLLGADWPSGYSLDPASLQVQGGTVQGNATAVGNSIRYTPPGTPDWNRIVFILKNPSRPNEDALGTLYVTVSDIANQAPVIGTPRYDYNYYNPSAGTPETFENRVIDLGSLSQLGISDPEGGAWQLVEVQSYSASVSPTDPTSVTNKRFTFNTGIPGVHVVSYIVGDHQGGFTTGLMQITVGAKERVKDWADITIGELTYFATPLYSEVVGKGVAAQGHWDNRVNRADSPPGNTIAEVTPAQASGYCSSNGLRLATSNQLSTLITTSAVTADVAKYPMGDPYIVSDDGGASYKLFDLDGGYIFDYDARSHGAKYVMCVKYARDGNMSYTPATPGYAISDGRTWHLLGEVLSDGGVSSLTLTSSTDLGDGTLSAANFRLNPEGCAGGRCTLEGFALPNPSEYGVASVRLTNAANSQHLDIGPITFKQDAKVLSLINGTNYSKTDGIAQNMVIATLVDSRDQPLPSGTKVRLTYHDNGIYESGITFIPASQAGGTLFTVGPMGTVTLALTSTIKTYEATGTIYVDPVVGGLGNTRSILSSFGPQGEHCGNGDVFITWTDEYFTCPLSQSEADRLGISHTPPPGYAMTENGKTYVSMTYPQADEYCRGIGYRVPNEDEMRRVDYSALWYGQWWGQWPESFPYWTSTHGMNPNPFNVVYNFQTGGTMNRPPSDLGLIATCVRARPRLP